MNKIYKVKYKKGTEREGCNGCIVRCKSIKPFYWGWGIEPIRPPKDCNGRHCFTLGVVGLNLVPVSKIEREIYGLKKR